MMFIQKSVMVAMAACFLLNALAGHLIGATSFGHIMFGAGWMCACIVFFFGEENWP